MSLEDNLDNFLDVIDEDPDWSSDEEEEDPIAARIDKELGSSTSLQRQDVKDKETAEKKAKDSLTFVDIFGSPIKKNKPQSNDDVYAKIIETIDPITTSLQPSTPSSGSYQQKQVKSFEIPSSSTPSYTKPKELKPFTPLVWTKPEGIEKNSDKPHSLPHKSSSSSDIVIDPYSRISLFKASVNLFSDANQDIESVLKERNIGHHYVNLISFAYWYKTSGKDNKKFWTSGVLTRKLANRKTSAAGNEYTLWEVNDLKDLENSWTVFLFGAAASASSLNEIRIGSVIDLVAPSVMENSSGPLKFSVSNANQIRHIGTSRYFGYCSAKKKDGQDCSGIVNTAECSVCIFHAGKELKKMTGKEKAFRKGQLVNGGGGGFGGGKNGGRTPGYKQFQNESPNLSGQGGIKIVNYGSPKPVPGDGNKKMPAPARMELQGGISSMQRRTITQGNHPSISFVQDKATNKHEGLAKVPKKAVKEPLKIDPNKSRHLTDKDRQILEALGAKDSSSDLPEILASNPNAGARNYLQYLAQEQHKLDMSRQKKESAGDAIAGYGQPISMNRTMLKGMKEALKFVRKNGPIEKVDPNDPSKSKKRKLPSSSPTSLASSSSTSSISSGSNSSSSTSKINSGASKRAKCSNIEVEFDFESDEFKSILNAKSKHEKILEEVQHEEYFSILEKKETLENKLLNTFSIPTSAVMCKECKYVAVGQSDYCKEKRHQIRFVKATKRFFKCKDCGNRAMSLDRLPKQPCTNCKGTSWLTTSVGKERKGPVLPSEVLSVRGDEERFVGDSGGQMFLNLSA